MEWDSIVCDDCEGTGKDENDVTCSTCNGEGSISYLSEVESN